MNFSHLKKEWLLSVDCIANNGEFFATENVTASPELHNGAGGSVTSVPGVYSLTGGYAKLQCLYIGSGFV